jgi:aerobic-type carbon monoxide dehydrogenase small subunit (CoxS/CutS family)
MQRTLDLDVNGRRREVAADGDRSLLSVLRQDLELPGSKYGCGEGACGACTVLVDGKAVRSCVLPVAHCAGKKITTIEGLAEGERLHPVQQAFLDEGAMQCGYCTPGMIVAVVGLLRQQASPSRADVVAALNGNLCRCCTYPRILRAVDRAVRAMGGGK